MAHSRRWGKREYRPRRSDQAATLPESCAWTENESEGHGSPGVQRGIVPSVSPGGGDGRRRDRSGGARSACAERRLGSGTADESEAEVPTDEGRTPGCHGLSLRTHALHPDDWERDREPGVEEAQLVHARQFPWTPGQRPRRCTPTEVSCH